MIRRKLNLLKSNSFFLFGARGTGKTTLLTEQEFLSTDYLLIDLLDSELRARLETSPRELLRIIGPAVAQGKWVLIDEVQKVPALLDLVHQQIAQEDAKFGLTGSSARKLRRGASNLLAGRAFTYNSYPLLWNELAENFSLAEALRWGTLPRLRAFTTDTERAFFLKAYAETYLQEEIVMEQIVRNLPPFRRFLQTAAQANACVINFAKIAADAVTDPSNVRNYFQILEDTLVGFALEPFHRSVRKRQRQSPKFYWFDTGVVRALSQQLDVVPRASTYEYGRLFESFIINQIRTALQYQGRQYQLSYLLTKDGAEIDLIVERAGEPTALIEIKSSREVRDVELLNLKRFSGDIAQSRPICLYTGERALLSDGVAVLPWAKGLAELGLIIE